MKRKACRRRVKAEMKAIGRPKGPRDDLRKRWIEARCCACSLCPELVRKLPPMVP